MGPLGQKEGAMKSKMGADISASGNRQSASDCEVRYRSASREREFVDLSSCLCAKMRTKIVV